jgi:hypothetical protein
VAAGQHAGGEAWIAVRQEPAHVATSADRAPLYTIPM